MPRHILYIILAVGSAYAFCAQAQFIHWDDTKHIFQNPLVFRPLGWDACRAIFTQTINDTYIPLTTLSFYIEYHLFGLLPWVTHVLNVVGHVCVTLLIYIFALRIGLVPWVALTGSMIFGLHPMHVESVAWATERKDVLCAFFYVLALITYLDYLEHHTKKMYLASLTCGFLAVLAKPMAVSLPWILFLMDYLYRRPWSPVSLLDKAPYGLLIFPIAAITFFHLGPHINFTYPASILIFFWSAWFYIWKFLAPYPLLPLYAAPQPVALTNPAYIWPIVGIVTFTAALCMAGVKRFRLGLFAGLFFTGTIFFFWRFDFADINIVADRFMYLPSVGICLLIGYWLRNVPRVALVSILIALGLSTFFQCSLWRTDETLWSWVLRHEPVNSTAKTKLNIALHNPPQGTIDYRHFDRDVRSDDAHSYLARGIKLVANGRLDLAWDDFNRAIAIDPNLEEAYINRGGIYQAKGNVARAMADFDHAIALNPGGSSAYLSKAVLLSLLHDDIRALEFFNTAVKVTDDKARAYFERGFFLRQQGKCHEAVHDFNLALKYRPNYLESHYNSGLCRMVLHEYSLAVGDFKHTVRLDPNNAAAYNEMGLAYYFLEKFEPALEAFNKAIALSAFNDEYYNNRALIFLKLNNYLGAMGDLDRAINMNSRPYRALVTRGDVYMEIGKMEKAIDDYSRAYELNNGDPLALLKRAKAYFNKEDFPKSLQDMDTVMQMSPNDETAPIIRERVYNALKAKQSGSGF
jgi:protein O-mannosyl-transferase